MNTNAVALVAALACFTCDLRGQAVDPSPDRLPARIRAIEYGSSYPGEPTRQAVQEYPVGEVAAKIMSRLSATGDDAPGEEGRGRLWMALALLPGDDADGSTISNPDRVSHLTDALINGPWDIKSQVINHFRRIAPAQRDAPAAALNDLVLNHAHATVVTGALQALGLTRSLSPQSVPLVRELMDLDYSSFPALQTTMETPGLSAWEGAGDPERIRQMALLAVLSTYPDPQAAAQYVATLPDEWSTVSRVMATVSGVADFLQSATTPQREAWIQEYLRRLCLPASHDFRNDGAYFWLLNMMQMFPDLKPVVCQWLEDTDPSCSPRNTDRDSGLLDLLIFECQ